MMVNSEHVNSVIPSSIVWTQTMESITLQINSNHVQVSLSEKCLTLSDQSTTINLPLFNRVYLGKYDIQQMTMTNQIILTLEKECMKYWPHLLMQQEEIKTLSSLVEINYRQQDNSLFDTLDFDTVISGSGEKTGLE
ncbi:hypothetical protein HPULCUR_001833 [Helicostylum pulchrum]|uniref:CS domain-containing protein n=1 Tax=Helicostylum pulchrum TaxID=562976 RepID=A0ABP9XNR8_9FUNG